MENANKEDNVRLQDYLKIIKNNEYIEKMYMQLAQLEIENNTNSDEYKNIIELIKDLSIKNTKLMKKYPLNDEFLENFLELMDSLNFYKSEDLNATLLILNNKLSLKNKKFIENILTLNTLRKDFSQEELIPDFDEYAVNYNGYFFKIDDLINYLEMSGNDEIADEIINVKDDLFDKAYEDICLRQKTYFVRIALQNHTILDYIQDEINNTTNEKIKNKLIQSKYKYICWCKSLEDAFLKNPYNCSKTKFYQSIFNESKEISDSYEPVNIEFNQFYTDNSKGLLNYLAYRDKEKYDNIDDLYDDVLRNILLKSYSSLITDRNKSNLIKKLKSAAIKVAQNDLNKKIIYNSIHLNKELILTKK